MGGPASLLYRRGAHSSSTSLAQLVDDQTPLDASALAAWVVGVPPSPIAQTPYAGISADHVLAFAGEVGSAVRCAPSLSDAPAFLRAALVAAVDGALAGARRVAVMTGGGLDSSVLLGLASQWAKRTGGSAFAISLDFEGPGDDRPHLRALEHYLACEVVRVRPEDAASRIALLATGADASPVTNATMPMEVEMLARARAHGAERVLDGAGADELFGGSPHALAEVAWRGHPLRAVRSASRLAGFRRPRVPAWSWVMRPLLGKMLPARLHAWRDRRSVPSVAAPAWAGPVARSFLEQQRRLAVARRRRPPRTAAQRFEAIRDAPHRVVLAWGRQQEEHVAGVEVWSPYQDLRLAAAVASLRPDYLLADDRWRGLLRASIRGLVPESIRERIDKARFEPALRRFVDAAGGLASLRPLASGRALASLGLVEPAQLEAAFERFAAAPDDGASWVSLWAPLAVEAFLRGRGG